VLQMGFLLSGIVLPHAAVSVKAAQDTSAQLRAVSVIGEFHPLSLWDMLIRTGGQTQWIEHVGRCWLLD
jgi:hypothetical protein